MKRLIITIATDYEGSGDEGSLDVTMHDPEMRKILISSLLDRITAKEPAGRPAVMWELKELKS